MTNLTSRKTAHPQADDPQADDPGLNHQRPPTWIGA